MLISFDETAKMIAQGTVLHIAGTEDLLKKLPKGNWVGGSTEYFMSKDGGKVTDQLLSVIPFPYEEFNIKAYCEKDIFNVAKNAYENGFSIAIVPFNSKVHKVYAEYAPSFKDMYIKNIAGWISGFNLGKKGQTPIAVNGQTGESHPDKAVVLNIAVPKTQTVTIGMINIFTQDETSPIIEFTEEGFSATKCLINGKETKFADYISQNKIDTKLPLVGNYSGFGVNVSFKAIEGDVVDFYAPVFKGIQYMIAKVVPDYAKEFSDKVTAFSKTKSLFSCNCILNFLYGELEGKKIENFFGPITFGEIAYQLVNQTLVYIAVQERGEGRV